VQFIFLALNYSFKKGWQLQWFFYTGRLKDVRNIMKQNLLFAWKFQFSIWVE